MITCRCPECRLVWGEDRGKGDSPIHHRIFLCPRCNQMADVNKPLFNPDIAEVEGSRHGAS